MMKDIIIMQIKKYTNFDMKNLRERKFKKIAKFLKKPPRSKKNGTDKNFGMKLKR